MWTALLLLSGALGETLRTAAADDEDGARPRHHGHHHGHHHKSHHGHGSSHANHSAAAHHPHQKGHHHHHADGAATASEGKGKDGATAEERRAEERTAADALADVVAEEAMHGEAESRPAHGRRGQNASAGGHHHAKKTAAGGHHHASARHGRNASGRHHQAHGAANDKKEKKIDKDDGFRNMRTELRSDDADADPFSSPYEHDEGHGDAYSSSSPAIPLSAATAGAGLDAGLGADLDANLNDGTHILQTALSICREKEDVTLSREPTEEEKYIEATFKPGSPRQKLVGDVSVLENSIKYMQHHSPNTVCKYPIITEVSASTELEPQRHAKWVPGDGYHSSACGIVIGIMGGALQAEARAVHRAVMEKVKWHKEMQCMQFFYVIGVKGLSDEEKAELKDEQKARGDLVWLNEDHINQGVASRDWFLHAHERFPKAWLIGKGNLDTFVHPANLFDQLRRNIPASPHLYYGMDCGNNKMSEEGEYVNQNAHMCSNLYFLGRDLVQCAFSAPFGESKLSLDDKEDLAVARVVFYSPCRVTFAADQLRFYSLQPLRHEGSMANFVDPHALPLCLTGETVAVSNLNSMEQWSRISKWLSMEESKHGQLSCMDHDETKYTAGSPKPTVPQSEGLTPLSSSADLKK